MYETLFPETVRASTIHGLIVINAGVHHHTEKLDRLERMASHLANQRLLGALIYVDSVDEQWPTSNGVFSTNCATSQCICEPVSGDKLLGYGVPQFRNMSLPLATHDPVNSTVGS